jgi:hypothetical protein
MLKIGEIVNHNLTHVPKGLCNNLRELPTQRKYLLARRIGGPPRADLRRTQ